MFFNNSAPLAPHLLTPIINSSLSNGGNFSMANKIASKPIHPKFFVAALIDNSLRYLNYVNVFPTYIPPSSLI